MAEQSVHVINDIIIDDQTRFPCRTGVTGGVSQKFRMFQQ
jgi:hypothetical protein